jgi:hypothetical protein
LPEHPSKTPMALATNKCFATTNLIAIRMIGSGVTDLVHRLIHGTCFKPPVVSN